VILLCARARVRVCGQGRSPGTREAEGALNLGWGPRETWEFLAAVVDPPLAVGGALHSVKSGKEPSIEIPLFRFTCSTRELASGCLCVEMANSGQLSAVGELGAAAVHRRWTTDRAPLDLDVGPGLDQRWVSNWPLDQDPVDLGVYRMDKVDFRSGPLDSHGAVAIKPRSYRFDLARAGRRSVIGRTLCDPRDLKPWSSDRDPRIYNAYRFA
jgi:hypothetical protein